MAGPAVKLDIQPQAQQTPTQHALAKSQEAVTVADAKGRRITLKRPGVLAQFRLIEALGPETAKNETYVNMVIPVIFVAEIDGDPVVLPASKREVEALIQRLDESGLSAVMVGVRDHFGSSDPEADKAAIKK